MLFGAFIFNSKFVLLNLPNTNCLTFFSGSAAYQIHGEREKAYFASVALAVKFRCCQILFSAAKYCFIDFRMKVRKKYRYAHKSSPEKWRATASHKTRSLF